jgi:hypothetical protein
MDQIQKLNKLQELMGELHQLSHESGVKTDIVAFDHYDIKVPMDTVITTTWFNDTNRVTKTQTFPLSMIDDFIYRIGEKIKYRRKIIEQLKENKEGK